MATPRHPKGKQIDQMLLRFCQTKEIEAETRVYRSIILNRSVGLGLKFYRITEEERRLLEARRREKGIIQS